jgi:hypothetical protein
LNVHGRISSCHMSCTHSVWLAVIDYLLSSEHLPRAIGVEINSFNLITHINFLEGVMPCSCAWHTPMSSI